MHRPATSPDVRRPFGARTTVAIALVAVSTLGVPGVSAGSETASRTVDRLQAWLDGADTIVGGFSQQLLSSALGADVEERGMLRVRRPGMMRWDYLDPEPKLALVRGREMLLYTPEDRQLIRGEIDDRGAWLVELLAGDERLVEVFDVSSTTEPDPGLPSVTRVELRPKRALEAFESVVVAVDERGAPVAAWVLDASGNRVLYRFDELDRNAPIASGAFEFEAPPGTEILE